VSKHKGRLAPINLSDIHYRANTVYNQFLVENPAYRSRSSRVVVVGELPASEAVFSYDDGDVCFLDGQVYVSLRQEEQVGPTGGPTIHWDDPAT
jgi:hypothetical protein